MSFIPMLRRIFFLPKLARKPPISWSKLLFTFLITKVVFDAVAKQAGLGLIV